MVPNLNNPDHTQFVEYITNKSSERGYSVSLLCAGQPDETFRKDEPAQFQFIERMAKNNAAGIIMTPTYFPLEDSIRNMTRQKALPYVIINDYWTDYRKDNHLCVDQEQAVETAVSYLVEKGHSFISLWMTVGDYWKKTAERFLEVLKSKDLPISDTSIITGEEKWLADGVKSIKTGKISALIVPYYTRACFINKLLERNGINIPKDISLFCLGTIPRYYPNYLEITGTINPMEQIAEEAIRLILKNDTFAITHRFFTVNFYEGKTVQHKGE